MARIKLKVYIQDEKQSGAVSEELERSFERTGSVQWVTKIRNVWYPLSSNDPDAQCAYVSTR